MKTFQIISSAGLEIGIYRAETKADALDEMARDAGYKGYTDACKVLSVSADYDDFCGTVKEIEVNHWAGTIKEVET